MWTDGEKAVLRELYPLHGPEWDGWDRELPGRSRNAIRSMASMTGVRRSKVASAWTPEQVRSLARWLARMSADIGRTTSECVRAASTLMAAYEEGAGSRRGRGRPLSDAEEVELLSCWRSGVTKRALAFRYGVTERTVHRWIGDALMREALGVIG